MTPQANDLYSVAARLDESPVEFLNGGALDALKALAASAPDTDGIAFAHGIEPAEVNALWERADARLRDVPGLNDLFPAAAEAATLLYTAAWVLDSDSITTEDLRVLL